MRVARGARRAARPVGDRGGVRANGKRQDPHVDGRHTQRGPHGFGPARRQGAVSRAPGSCQSHRQRRGLHVDRVVRGTVLGAPARPAGTLHLRHLFLGGDVGGQSPAPRQRRRCRRRRGGELERARAAPDGAADRVVLGLLESVPSRGRCVQCDTPAPQHTLIPSLLSLSSLSPTAARRTVASTRLNISSSRSHAVITIHLTPRSAAPAPPSPTSSSSSSSSPPSGGLPAAAARLVFVDLAGSELVGKAHLSSQQIEEAKVHCRPSLSRFSLFPLHLSSTLSYEEATCFLTSCPWHPPTAFPSPSIRRCQPSARYI